MINRKIIISMKQSKMPCILSPVQLKIIHYLFEHEHKIIFQKDIERIIESRRSTTSGILRTMEKNKLIQRVASEEDNRSKKIILTEYSKQISKTMIKQKKQFEEKIVENITPEELNKFFKVTEKIKNNIMNMK